MCVFKEGTLATEAYETTGNSAKALGGGSAFRAAGGEYAGACRVAFRLRFACLLQHRLLSRASSPGPRHAEGQERLRCARQDRCGGLLDASLRRHAKSGRRIRSIHAGSTCQNFLRIDGAIRTALAFRFLSIRSQPPLHTAPSHDSELKNTAAFV